jgi:RNase H-like domain found in reverse transcriptase
MLCEDEKWHPCAYLSQGLNDVERNYNVHDKEMLGIIWKELPMKLRFGQIIKISNTSCLPKTLIGAKHIGHYFYHALISNSHINWEV